MCVRACAVVRVRVRCVRWCVRVRCVCVCVCACAVNERTHLLAFRAGVVRVRVGVRVVAALDGGHLPLEVVLVGELPGLALVLRLSRSAASLR